MQQTQILSTLFDQFAPRDNSRWSQLRKNAKDASKRYFRNKLAKKSRKANRH